MALGIFDPARTIVQTLWNDFGNRAKIEVAKLALGFVAVALLVSSGLVALAQAVGYPIAAMVFAAIFGLLALAVHLIGRALASRQSQRIARAQSRIEADIAFVTSVARSALPLLPVVAFIAAFTFARRR